MTTRVTFVEACQAARAVNRRANGVKLSVRDRKVLSAVIDLTAMYSKLADHVYLAQLAAVAFGVDEAEPWMCNKTRESLAILAKHEVIYRMAPRGRSWGRPYMISLVPLAHVTHPESGATADDVTHPEPGANEDLVSHPEPGVSEPGNAPRKRPVTHPGNGTPTEKTELPTSHARSTHEGAEASTTKGAVTGKRIFTEMARRRLGLAREQGADWAPPAGCRRDREEGWLRSEFEKLRAEHGFELDLLIARLHPENPAQPKYSDPDYYVWRLDRTLAKRDWSQPTAEETRAKLDRERAENAARYADPDKVAAGRQHAHDFLERHRARTPGAA